MWRLANLRHPSLGRVRERLSGSRPLTFSPKGSPVMRTPRIRRLFLLLFAVAAAVTAPVAIGPVSPVADGVCNAGTHWDNYYNACVQ